MDLKITDRLEGLKYSLAMLAGLVMPGVGTPGDPAQRGEKEGEKPAIVKKETELSLSEFKLSGHVHRDGCHKHCPKEGEPGFNSITKVPPGSDIERSPIARTLKADEIKTWTKISDLPAPLKDFLVAWDKSTTLEEIRHITSPEKSPILSSFPKDAARWAHPEYLIWLKDHIQDGKVPFTLTLKDRSELPDPNLHGYVAHSVYSKDGRPLDPTLLKGKNLPEGAQIRFDMVLRREYFENLDKELQALEKKGGWALILVPTGTRDSSPSGQRYEGIRPGGFAVLMHEMTHIYERVYGYPYSQEAGPEMSTFTGLGTVSPDDYQKHFRPLFRPEKK
jgi:hypothetical protein